MRSLGIRLPLFAATAWAGIGLSVWGMDLRYGETVYVTPTSRTVVLPGSYVLSTSYVQPTSYVVPSAYVVPSYYTTAYVSEPISLLPTAYVATTYRRGLLGRRWLVERPVVASYATTYVPSVSYLPAYYTTSYRTRSYRPTIFEYPTIWETSYLSAPRSDCDEVTWGSPASSSVYGSPAEGGAKATQSQSTQERTISSSVDPTLPEEPPVPTPPLPENPATKGQAAGSPRAASTAVREQNSLKAPLSGTAQPDAGEAAKAGTSKSAIDPATKGRPAAPAAPSGDPNDSGLVPAPGTDGSGTIRRDTLRPNYSARTLRASRRNVLVGRIESDAGEPRGEVAVTVSSRNNSLIHHDGMSNAFGSFAIRLPDGEWTVKVTMPSGRVYSVRQITVSEGRVMDLQEGREVHELLISY
jgi:hypothetical protein